MQSNSNLNAISAKTIEFKNKPYIIGNASVAGKIEGEGKVGEYIDKILPDDLLEQETWEKAESKMFEMTVEMALEKAKTPKHKIDCLIGGDLLNQIIASSFAARNLGLPFLGQYGACSTMAQSLLVGSIMVSGGFAKKVACATSSHFCTAERQYRSPLELGYQPILTSQRTVTGSGCVVLSEKGLADNNVVVTHATIGKVIDYGIADPANMGAAMAPSAADTIVAHLLGTNRNVSDYDLIVTGDLGKMGSELCQELCQEKGVDLSGRYFDCGAMIFAENQNTHCGGSGCGCSAVVLNSFLMHRLRNKYYKRILFAATGALMSPISAKQGETVPGICHAVVLEREDL